MDGTNTRSPIGTRPWSREFEPMRAVRLENDGDLDVVNPWLTVNGKRSWRTAKDIVHEALRSYGDPARMSGREKAQAIYEFQRRHRFHASSADLEVRDPVKMFNIYGYTLCGDNAPVLMDLWRLAGLKVRRSFLMGHCVGEVWFDGEWHMLDGDGNVFYLRRDNRTIANEDDLVRDHDLIKRTHAYGGINTPDDRMRDESTAALYVFEGRKKGEYPSHVGHTMDLTLRPGEALEWRWNHVGKHHYSNTEIVKRIYGSESQHLKDGWGDEAWATLSNGKWIYEPPLRRASARSGVAGKNIRWAENVSDPAAFPLRPGERSSLIWKIQPPYVIVGGRLAAQIRRGPGDECSFSISIDGENWKPIEIAPAKSEKPIEVSLDEFFPSQGDPIYRYWLRMEMRAGSNVDQLGLEKIRIENDLQMAPLSLPALEVGSNQIVYRDETHEPHQVRVTFEWLERSTSRPPAAPAAALFPVDGAKVRGTKFRFQWTEARDPDADSIVDYHFQLSDESSLRWVLSSNFDKLVSNTADRGSPSYSIPYEGLLNPGQRYYWRVRARDEKGVWSDWSKEWSFEVEAAGVPLALQLEEGEEVFALKWKENPQGLRPVQYEIYASNEKGFSVSDKPYGVNAGSQKPANRKITFPPNLLTSTSATSLILKPEHAFYRVVAVDENGNKSGPSDYVSAPRPFIYSTPPTEARVGKEYRYEIKTIQAIGDLRCRMQEDDSYPDTYCDYAFWNKEEPNFSLVQEGPICGWRDTAWLKLDPKNGLLSGIPQREDIDEYQVNIVVEIEGQGRELQSFVLKVLP